MRDLNKIIRIFLENYPNALYEDFLTAFGSPEYMANEMMLCDAQQNRNHTVYPKRNGLAAGLAIAGLLGCIALGKPHGYEDGEKQFPTSFLKEEIFTQAVMQPQAEFGLVLDLETGKIISVSFCDA